jgi:ribosomal-protein-alanine N-acetyltransferase
MSKYFSLETARLRIRLLTMADFDFFFALQSDAEMMRYIRPPETDPEQVKSRIEMYEKYAAENPGMGAFRADLKSTGVSMATGVLRHMDLQPGNDLEVGYLVLRDYWGQGLASEMTLGVVQYAFEKFGVDRIKAVVAPENLASQKVLIKCGFQLIGRRFIYESDNLEFELLRAPD